MNYNLNITLSVDYVIPIFLFCSVVLFLWIWTAIGFIRIAKTKDLYNCWMLIIPIWCAYKRAELIDSKFVMGRFVWYRLDMVYVILNGVLLVALFNQWFLAWIVLGVFYLYISYYILAGLYDLFLGAHSSLFLFLSVVFPFSIPYFVWRCSVLAISLQVQAQELESQSFSFDEDWGCSFSDMDVSSNLWGKSINPLDSNTNKQ